MTDRSDKLLKSLEASNGLGKLPHGFLITGGTAEGREAFANAIAVNIFSSDPHVRSKIENDNFEDILRVRPDGDTIKVAQIEELTRNLRNKPFSHARMMAIISSAETMTPQSQNKLLKALEEPAAGNVIALLTSNREALFKTIISRTIGLHIGDIPHEADNDMQDKAKSLISVALDRRKPVTSAFAEISEFADDRDSSVRLISAMNFFLRDIIVGGFCADLAWNKDNAMIAAKMTNRSGLLRSFIGITEQSRAEIDRGINRKSALKDMLLRMRMAVESSKGTEKI